MQGNTHLSCVELLISVFISSLHLFLLVFKVLSEVWGRKIFIILMGKVRAGLMASSPHRWLTQQFRHFCRCLERLTWAKLRWTRKGKMWKGKPLTAEYMCSAFSDHLSREDPQLFLKVKSRLCHWGLVGEKAKANSIIPNGNYIPVCCHQCQLLLKTSCIFDLV